MPSRVRPGVRSKDGGVPVVREDTTDQDPGWHWDNHEEVECGLREEGSVERYEGMLAGEHVRLLMAREDRTGVRPTKCRL